MIEYPGELLEICLQDEPHFDVANSKFDTVQNTRSRLFASGGVVDKADIFY